jgi:protein TonB
VVAIELADIKKKEPPKPKPAPPPPPPKEDKPKPAPPRPAAQQAQAKTQEEPTKEAPHPADVGADGFADLGGVWLGGGRGETVPVATASLAAASARVAAPPPKATAHRVEQLVAPEQGGCTEPIVKPKVKKPGQIKYTKEAQEAEIEGVVRVQVTIDEAGNIIAASVLAGLGYGLDERALAAAKETLFEPATLCGKPVVATKVLAFTFGLR